MWGTFHFTVHAVYPVVSTTVTGIIVDSKTFWKISHVLFNFELSYIMLDSLWMFAKFNAQFWNTEHHRQAFSSKENNSKVRAVLSSPMACFHHSQTSFILSEPHRKFWDMYWLRLSTFYLSLEWAGVLWAKLYYDMRFLQSLSFLLSSVAWLHNPKLEFVPFVCIPGCHFHDNYSLFHFLRCMWSIILGVCSLSISIFLNTPLRNNHKFKYSGRQENSLLDVTSH